MAKQTKTAARKSSAKRLQRNRSRQVDPVITEIVRNGVIAVTRK